MEEVEHESGATLEHSINSFIVSDMRLPSLRFRRFSVDERHHVQDALGPGFWPFSCRPGVFRNGAPRTFPPLSVSLWEAKSSPI